MRLLQQFRIERVIQCQLFQTQERTIFYKAITPQPIISTLEKSTRNFRHIAILAPTPVRGHWLILRIIHTLGIHSSVINNLTSHAIVEEHVQWKTLPTDGRPETTIKLRIGVTQIHDVQLVYRTIMVNILIDCISSPETVFIRRSVCEIHRNGVTGTI